MDFYKKKNTKIYSTLFFLLIIILLFYFFYSQYVKNKKIVLEPITINLLTSVHPKLPWTFTPLKPKILISPGEVATIEYIVENLENNLSTGIATFQYFPREYGTYVSKINCFCYDSQTLKAREKSKYSFVMFIDPEVTKDSKTKHIKEITIQFTFFDYKEYKKTEN